MKFGIISDVHLGENCFIKGVNRKLGNHSEKLLKKFVNTMNNKVKPNFVMNLGDLIERKDQNQDKANYSKGLKILNNLKCPLYNVIGNHELKNLSKSEIKNILKISKFYYSCDIKYIHLIVLFSSWHKDRIIIGSEQIKWLKKDLRETENRVIVFVHHPLADQNLRGNFWFEGRENKGLISNRQEIRKIIQDSGKVLAVFNGHVHWNKLNVHNKIPHFTIQSLVENFDNKGIPAAAYAVCEIKSRSIECRVFGEDSCEMKHDF